MTSSLRGHYTGEENVTGNSAERSEFWGGWTPVWYAWYQLSIAMLRSQFQQGWIWLDLIRKIC